MDNKTIRSYGEQALRDEAQSILDQIALLDDNFEKAVDMMYHCQGKIIVTGVGKSGHVGAKIAATLASTGTPAFYINPLDVYHGDLGVMTDKDVVLALSNSGQTDELLRFIPMVLHMNVPIISITGNPNSLLAKYSNHHITVKVKKEACPLNLAPTSSTTAALAMGDALAIALMQVRHFKPRDFAQFHPGGELGKRLLTTAEDVMRSEDMPIIPKEMHLGEAIIHVSKGKLGLGISLDEKPACHRSDYRWRYPPCHGEVAGRILQQDRERHHDHHSEDGDPEDQDFGDSAHHAQIQGTYGTRSR